MRGCAESGIDEISYKKGHKYLTVVVDHDSGRLVWAAEGRSAATLRLFFDLLGEQRCAAITHVSADAAAWIAKVVTERCPQAIRCADPFHVVAWATAAADKVRRGSWNRARAKARPRKQFGKRGRPRAGTGNTPDADREQATVVKKSRWALLKNPEKPDREAGGDVAANRTRGPRPAPCLPAQGIVAADLPDEARRRGRGTAAMDRPSASLPTSSSSSYREASSLIRTPSWPPSNTASLQVLQWC